MKLGQIPSQLGPWQIGEEIGRGGMGTVYEAVSVEDGRAVAVKVLNIDLVSDLEYLKRFRREIKAGIAVSSPYVVKVFEWGQTDGWSYFAMELLSGGKDLHQILKEDGPLSQEEALQTGIYLAMALSALHEQSVIHRDIKPGNLMRLPDGTVKLMDLGLARILDRTALTATGEALGSPRYMAPEILSGKLADFRSDVYQVGVLLYELVSGVPAFDHSNFERLLQMIIDDPPQDISKKVPGISSDLAHIIHKCLKKRPSERYKNVDDLREELEKVDLSDSEACDATEDGEGLTGGSGSSSGKSANSEGKKSSSSHHLSGSGKLKSSASFSIAEESKWSDLSRLTKVFIPAFLFSLVILMVLYLVFLVGHVPVVDPEIYVRQGLRVVEVGWKTALECPTKAKVGTVDGSVKSFSNNAQKSVKEHNIILSDIKAGSDCRLRLYGIPKSKTEGLSFKRYEKTGKLNFQVNRNGTMVTVSGKLPPYLKPSLKILVGKVVYNGLNVSKKEIHTGLNNPVQSVVLQATIPAFVKISDLSVLLIDGFGESTIVSLSPPPGTRELLISSAIDGKPLDLAVDCFIREANMFFSDGTIHYEVKKEVYDLLIGAKVNESLLEPFVRWSAVTDQDPSSGNSYKPVSATFPATLTPEVSTTEKLYIFKLDKAINPAKDVSLVLLRSGIDDGRQFRLQIGDNFQIIDGNVYRNNKLSKVIFPAHCLGNRKLVIVRIVAESLVAEDKSLEPMQIKGLEFTILK